MSSHEILRLKFAQIIEQTIADIEKNDVQRIRSALRQAYPLNNTKSYEYQLWLREIHHQLGFKLKRARKHKDQLELFE